MNTSHKHKAYVTQSETADLVFTSGAVYTVNADRSWAQAVAIKGNRICYVGTDSGVGPHVGSATEVIHLKGKMVLPGFVDSHAHPPSAAKMIVGANLFGLDSLEAYREAVAAFAAAHPSATVIRGFGWSDVLFPLSSPRKETLDQIEADRPVSLTSYDGHSTWVNSKALEWAGISDATSDPQGGIIERDPSTGEPTGTLRDSAAFLVEAVLPSCTTEDKKKGLLAYQAMAGECGITMAHDAIVSRSIDAYRELEAEGLLAMRYRGSLLVDPDKGPEQVAGLVAERDRHKGPHFQTGSAKIFLDGGIEGATAFLLQPYAHRPGFSGEPLWDIENLRQVCVELDRAGFQIHVHVIGDAATRVTLDVFDHVRRTNGRRAARNLITHMQLVAPEDIARFAELGVVGVPQSFWFAIDDYYWKIYLPYLGKERADKMYPLQSFIDAKVVLASASDYPVTIPCNPVLGIQMGVTRSRPGKNSDPRLELREGDFGVLWPEERVGVSDMIATFTVNGAYANFLEHETGTLEMGKLADMVVLDRNLFDVAVTEIAEANVLMTLFEGRQVYRHPAL